MLILGCCWSQRRSRSCRSPRTTSKCSRKCPSCPLHFQNCPLPSPSAFSSPPCETSRDPLQLRLSLCLWGRAGGTDEGNTTEGKKQHPWRKISIWTSSTREISLWRTLREWKKSLPPYRQWKQRWSWWGDHWGPLRAPPGPAKSSWWFRKTTKMVSDDLIMYAMINLSTPYFLEWCMTPDKMAHWRTKSYLADEKLLVILSAAFSSRSVESQDGVWLMSILCAPNRRVLDWP